MHLQWRDIDGEWSRLALDPLMETVTIGRSPASTIQFQDESVSRNHARIGCASSGFFVKDLGSANGCFVNGARVQRVELRTGDVLRCGKHSEIQVCVGALPPGREKPVQLREPSQRHAVPLEIEAPRQPDVAPSGDRALELALQRVTDLETQLAQARAHVSAQHAEVNALRVRVAQQDAQLDGMQRQLAAQSVELQQTRAENDGLQSHVDQEGDGSAQKDRTIALLRDVIAGKEKYIAQLQRESDASALAAEKTRLIAELQQAQRQLAAHHKSVGDVTDAAKIAHTNAIVLRRYAEDLQDQRAAWPEMADALELVHDIASVLVNDLAEQVRELERFSDGVA